MTETCHSCEKEFEIMNEGILFAPVGETGCSPFTTLIALCDDCKDDEKYSEVIP